MILLPIFVSVTNKTKFMPEICRFFGIIIFLYWKDHNPPHIHFTYGDYECSISVLVPGSILRARIASSLSSFLAWSKRLT